MEKTDLFWKSEHYSKPGTTAEMISDKEKELHVEFPEKFRQLMMIQNGGSMRNPAYLRDNEIWYLFNFGCLDAVDEMESFDEVLWNWMDNEDIERAKARHDYCYPERLIVFSGLDGHSFACFDYGWMKEEKQSVPSVVFLGEESDAREDSFGYEEKFRIENFETLLDGLVHAGYEAEGYYIGVHTDNPIPEFVKTFSNAFDCHVEEYHGGEYSWFEKNSLFVCDMRVEGRQMRIQMSPNRYSSGGYMFWNHEDCPFIIEIEQECIDAVSSGIFNEIVAKLQGLFGIKILLAPTYFEGLTEREI